MEIEDHVRQLLEEHFPGAEINIDPLNGSQKVSGYLVWQGFEEQEQIDRQRTLGAYLREALGADAQRVSTILTYTPHEFHLMAAA